MIRLFTALPLADECVGSLSLIRRSLPGVRWIDRANLHITLQFIGEVEEAAYHDIAEALAEVRSQPFEYAVSGGGYFGKARNPRVLWAGIASCPGLLALHRAVGQALAPLVELEQRKYAPHISLARFKRVESAHLANLLEAAHFLDIPAQKAREFCLFSSRRGPEGSEYTVEASYPLDG